MRCVGTGDVILEAGSIVDRGPEEYYTSAPYRLPAGCVATAVAWEAETPAVAFATLFDEYWRVP